LKQFIVLTAMVALGIILFQLIAGPQDSSIMHILAGNWNEEILIRSSVP